jgi:hypothetical protein
VEEQAIMTKRLIGRASAVLGSVALGLALLATGCGDKGGGGAKAAEAKKEIDADPIALLPSGPILVATVDTKAFFASATVGPQVAQLVERYAVIPEEAGFKASRDVDRVTVGFYSVQGADGVAVLMGRFDAAKIKQFADAKGQTPRGPVVASQYAGKDVYTVSNIGCSVLTPKAALCGTEAAIRRALDRVRDGHVQRDVPPWMAQTLESPNAAAAVAGDFTKVPLSQLGSGVPPWLGTVKSGRVLADFKDPGINVAGSLSYDDPQKAQAAVDQLAQLNRMAGSTALKLLGVPEVQKFDAKVEKNDAQFSFALDDRGMRQIVAMTPRVVGQ